MSNVIAVVCSDLHISHRKPSARAEDDWYAAMISPLNQIQELCNQYKVQAIYAGDLFHTFNEPAEAINFALSYLPDGLAIPGQHDLPFHSYEDLHKSAFWTLVRAKKLTLLESSQHTDGWHHLKNTNLFAFPWGHRIKEPTYENDGCLNVAVIHKYIWKKEHEHPGAKKEESVLGYRKQLEGYNTAIFGDNHTGFSAMSGNCRVFNCGCVIRRRMNERNYQPQVGLLKEDGKVEPIKLDVSKEKFYDAEDIVAKMSESPDMMEFIDELVKLADEGLDFREELIQAVKSKKVKEPVKKIIHTALDASAN